MRQWLRRLWRENVVCDDPDNTLVGHLSQIGDANWEPVQSATEPIMRCRRCGDLIRLAYLTEHDAVEHGQRTVAVIRLYADGDSGIITDRAMRLHPNHVRSIRTFLESQNDALLSEAVAEIQRTGARGQAELMRLLATTGPVQ